MKPISTNFPTYLRHTKQYYRRLLTPKRISVIALGAAMATTAAIGVNTVVARADAARWMLEDAFSEDIFFGKYDYIYNEDAPEESNNQFHLQMPMMFEGYLDAGIYVSDESNTSNPKLDTAVESAIKPGFFNAQNFELPTQEEWEKSAEDATEFVEDRPPKSYLE